MANIRPIGTNIVAKEIKEDEDKKTSSGLFVANLYSDDAAPKATVVAVGEGWIGPDGTQKSMLLSVGDIIFYKANTETKLNVDGEDYISLTYNNVIGVIDNG